eukprot:TRINITY_DN3696_c0_g1_i1.p1 TRINITY_DN3696_c0_g1~~TRINITY_DN3696_c0_g1_i1.p1  ORF type:complete len:288 (-),score=43.23 TRINITY_DN3696_c0_g1_i1:116-979(-)
MTQAPALWQPSDLVTHCSDCRSQFWFFLLKHHCRLCGRVFCYNCNNTYLPLPQFGFNNPVPICNACAHSYDSNNQTRQGTLGQQERQLSTPPTTTSSSVDSQHPSIPQTITSEVPQTHPPAKKINTSSRTPRTFRDKKFWKVEYYTGDKDVIISEATQRQCVHIFECVDCIITINGRVNEILIDKSENTTVVFSEVISSIDIINSKKVTLCCLEKTPSVQIEKSDTVNVRLPAEQMENLHLMTSCAADVTVTSEPKTKLDQSIEYAIPQQLVTQMVEGQLIFNPIPK